jgi:hypothetical protein
MIQSDYQVDSMEFRYNMWGDSLQMPTSKSIEEVKVISGNFNAEYGESSGVVVNAVTKSGTNKLHGQAYDELGNDKLNSVTYNAAPQKAPIRFNQFGFDVGGPVWLPHIYDGRDKTFFYFNYEGIRKPSSTTITNIIPPTAAMKQGNFTAITKPIIDPVTGQQFDYGGTPNVIDPSREDPATKIWMGLIPLPNQGNVWAGNFSTPGVENQYTIKIDQQIGSKSHLFGRWI